MPENVLSIFEKMNILENIIILVSIWNDALFRYKCFFPGGVVKFIHYLGVTIRGNTVYTFVSLNFDDNRGYSSL